MFIKKYFKARHLILKTLFDHDNSFPVASNSELNKLHFNEIAQRLPQFDKLFLLDNLDYLRNKNEIYCSNQFDNSTFAIIGLGRHAYVEKKYLMEGHKEFRNSFDQKLKIISTIILLFIAVVTFIINVIQTQRNKTDLEQVKFELQQLKHTVNNKSSK